MKAGSGRDPAQMKDWLLNLANIERHPHMIGFLAFMIGAIPASAAQLPAQPSVKAITHVAVIPMEDTNQVLTDQTVVVRGGLITALGPAAKVAVPAGALRIDGRGKYLIPGLADMHAHVGAASSAAAGKERVERALFLFAANGVTTIRNLNYVNDESLMLVERARAAAGALWSPRIYTAGPWRPTDSQSVAQSLRAYQAAGYDFVKLHGEGGALLDSIAAAAHLLGLPFVGHVEPGSYQESHHDALLHALAVQYASIEHLTGYPADNWDGKLGADTADLAAEVAATQRSGVWNVPTQALHEIWDVAPATWPEVRYGFWVKDTNRITGSGSLPYADSNVARWNAYRHRIIKALQDAGAGLLLGTDEPLGALVPGFASHRELQALVRSGLTPYQALATGTRNVAAYFGHLHDEGTIAIGKRADLVLLNGNPLANIENTMNPAGVMVNGRWLSRTVIDHGLQDILTQLVAERAPEKAP